MKTFVQDLVFSLVEKRILERILEPPENCCEFSGDAKIEKWIVEK